MPVDVRSYGPAGTHGGGRGRALTLPSRYCLPDVLGDESWSRFGGLAPTFDPRNNTRRKGHVVICRGRDASDVAMATTFGGPLLESMLVHAHEAAG